MIVKEKVSGPEVWRQLLMEFSVKGQPVPQGSSRAFLVKGRPVITSANRNLSSWRTLVSLMAQDHAPPEPTRAAVEVKLTFYLPVPTTAPKRRRLQMTKRPDLDKLTRAVLDSLTGLAFADDSQVVAIHATKIYAYEEPPGVSVSVWSNE